MRNQIANYLDNAITLLLLLVAGVTPLLFLNQTTEFYEMPKLLFLFVAVILLFGMWIFSWIVKGRIILTRTPLDLPLIGLLVIVILSTYFSSTKLAAIYGNFPQVHGSAVSWVVYILLYFVAVSNLKRITQIKTFLYVLYASAVAVAIVTLLSFFHLFLPFDFAQGVNFTPTGSSFSTIAFLLLLLPLPLLSLVNQNKYLPLPFSLALAILFGVTIILTGSITTYIALLIVVALCMFVARGQFRRRTDAIVLFLVPVIVMILTFALAYLPIPGNGVQQLEASFPKEIQLPFSTSWKVTASVFRDATFLGTGPSTYLFDFTTYKPAEFNLLPIWNISFGSAHDEFLQVLGTLGILGLFALVFFSLAIINISRKTMSFDTSDVHQDSTHVLLPALSVSALTTIILLAIHATTLVSFVVSLLIVAAFMMSQRSVREKVTELSLGIKASTGDNNQFDLFPILLFVVFLIIAVPVLYQSYNIVSADYYHRLALNEAAKSGRLTYQYLQTAEKLNPYVDLYRVDMAQTNFVLANALAARAINNKTKLSDQEKSNIQALLSQSVNESRASVLLNPRAARNWEVLASIYRNISGVAQNALAFSLSAYGQAIQLDPLNPTLRLNVGGIYYAAKNYDLAIRFFTDAANLKPDYANAYYNLAIAYKAKGDLQSALVVANQTVALLQQNNPHSPDYKVATQFLADLKAAIATGSAAQSNEQAPAAQTDSALQNPNLTNVNVKSVPQVATPSAVKSNPKANLPQTLPTSPAR